MTTGIIINGRESLPKVGELQCLSEEGVTIAVLWALAHSILGGSGSILPQKYLKVWTCFSGLLTVVFRLSLDTVPIAVAYRIKS